MTDLDEEIAKLVLAAEARGASEDECAQILASALEGLVDFAGQQEFLRTLRRHARKTLRTEKSRHSSFEKRNRRRWKKPLVELRTLVCGCEEIAAEVAKDFDEGRIEEAASFAALNHLFVKAALTMREVVCLIEGGFADAALARWRTLHELAVFATFIFGADELIAARYVASFEFRALSAAKQLNKYAERARMEACNPDEIAHLEARCQALSKELGPRLGDEYGWAWPKLDARKLLDLEEATGLDHWRPRYKWASQNVHGGFRPPMSSLGMSEAEQPAHLTGPSNSGMVDPIHMAALSFMVASSAFLLRWPNTFRLMGVGALSKIAEEVGSLAVGVEEDSLRRSKLRMRRGMR